MKRIFGLLMVLLLLGCSVEGLQTPIMGLDGQDGIDGINGIDGKSVSTTSTVVNPSDEYPWGGIKVDIYTDGVLTDSFVIENGADGKDGADGINGIDGIDGVDGVSATAYLEYVEPNEEHIWGGYYLYFGVGEDIQKVFLSNGADGINGIDGIDGQDGVNAVAWVEEDEGGYWLYFGTDTQVSKVFIRNGKDGTNGIDGIDGIKGTDGQDGTDGTDGKDGISVTVRTEEYEGGTILYITDSKGTTKIIIEDGEDGYNGTDGTNGIDGKDGKDGADGADGEDGTDGKNGINGIDGIDGEDGVSVTVRTEKGDGGYWLFITDVNGTVKIFIADGEDGKNGLDGDDGDDGTDGEDGKDGYNTLIEITILEPGEEDLCPYGGVQYVTGLDVNRNGIIDFEEAVYTIWCSCGCPDEEEEEKVTLCHKKAIGNDWKFVTLILPQSAVQAHLDHGDCLGSCEDTNNCEPN